MLGKKNIKETVALILAQTKQKGDSDMDFDTNKTKRDGIINFW